MKLHPQDLLFWVFLAGVGGVGAETESQYVTQAALLATHIFSCSATFPPPSSLLQAFLGLLTTLCCRGILGRVGRGPFGTGTPARWSFWALK